MLLPVCTSTLQYLHVSIGTFHPKFFSRVGYKHNLILSNVVVRAKCLMGAPPSVFDRRANLAGGYHTPSLVENGLTYPIASRKKSRCPGEKPVCSHCARLSQSCFYADEAESNSGRAIDRMSSSRPGSSVVSTNAITIVSAVPICEGCHDVKLWIVKIGRSA
jgi:hypothetical protein